MASPISLAMTADQHAELQRHLFPGDGQEAVALALCGRRNGSDRHRLLVRRIVTIPYESCKVRRPDRVTWSTELLPRLLEEAEAEGLAVLKIHSHPEGLTGFSSLDDHSDRTVFEAVHCWLGTAQPHASAIMVPDGRLIGRAVQPDGAFLPLSTIAVVGDDLRYFSTQAPTVFPEFAQRVVQAFGGGTFAALRRLRIAVVGISGTGSPVVEQLARNGVGELVLVDPDRVERVNLTRILNATRTDAETGSLKVDVQARAIHAMGLGTRVITVPTSLLEPEAVRAVADCDVVFGCSDTLECRHLLNRLATFYLLPYIDLGVRLEPDGRGSLDQVCGAVHYVKPGGESLLRRGVYTLEQLRSEGLSRTDPAAHTWERSRGYLAIVGESRPAVISVNMFAASLAVNELLARLHPYRLAPNSQAAVQRFSLSAGEFFQEPEGEPCPVLAPHLGRGDTEPLLGLPSLSELEGAA